MRSEVTSRSNWAKDSKTLSVSLPIEVVVLNCWVTETNDTPWASNSSTSLAKSAKRAGQAIDLVDDNDIDPVGSNVGEELLQGRAVGGSAREAAIVISGTNQCPAGMGLTADIGLRRIILRIERVEVLIEARFGRDPGIDGTAD